MDYKEHHRLNEEFLKMFPLEKLKDMTIEQYTNLNRSDSFCYWVEFKTEILGSVSGNSSFKFGIYRYNQKPKGDKSNILFDDKYAWYSSFGKTASEAFENVKKVVVKVAESGNVGDLDAIESIKELAPMIKWKIAFLYSNESIIPYYSLDRLRVIGEKMGMNVTKDSSIAEIQKYLINKRNGRDIHEYGYMLDELWKENDTAANSDHAKVWMYKRYEDAFAIDYIRMGSEAKGKLDFSTFKTKKAMGDAYRKVAGNTDVAIPHMYWQLIKDVKPGDIVVVFDSQKGKESKVSHLLYGWGRVTSDVIFDKNDDNPIHRNVDWHKPLPQEPIIEDMTNNTRYFHEVKGEEAANIMNLLGINKEDMSTNKNYWLAGYYIDNKSELDDFYAKNEWRAWFDEKDVIQIEQAKSIKKGDILIMKSTFTKGPKKSISCMKVRAIAVVESEIETMTIEGDSEGVRCLVRFISKEDKEFEGRTFGSYRRTIQNCDNKEIIDYVNSFFLEAVEKKKEYDKYIKLLEANKNLILTGSPGTGKTFMAKEIAKAMDAEWEFVQFHPSYDYTDFVEGLRPSQQIVGEVGFERRDGAFKEFCKRAAKNLEDSKKTKKEITEEKSFEDKYNEVVEGILNGEITEFDLKSEGKTMEVVKLSENNNIILKTPGSSSLRTYTVSFNRLSKLAKEYPDTESLNSMYHIYYAIRNAIGGCNASAYWAVLNEVYQQEPEDPTTLTVLTRKKPFVFIIDEINRGEISKIFGELFFSIDPGYRGVKGRVKTQYQNLIDEGDIFLDGFYVPENVYIIGTMNDIDRSVESMDFAMRRRFAWAEVTAEESMKMLSGMEYEGEAKKRMQNLNAAILKVRGLGEAYQIGAAYFKKIKDYDGDFQKLWDFHLKGLLFEYLRGSMNAEEQLVELKQAYDN